jgi:heme/copper-type cytochrome/quinol oxidase subunit 1
MSAIDESQRKAGRVAGFTYLFTFAIVVFSNFAIHDRLNVAGNAAATAQNILAHETLFRIGIACDLVYCIGVVIVLTALYVILEPVNRGLALLAALWKLVYALAWVFMTLKFFDALRLLDPAAYLRVFETERLQALAKLYLSARFDRYYGGLLFYAL